MLRRKNFVLEMLSAFAWAATALWMELFCIILFVYLTLKCGIIGKLFIIAYSTYWYNDRHSAENGRRGQGFELTRSCGWMKHFSKHFPVKCVKTVDLPPDRNYLFGVFPHGVISIGAFVNFGTNCTNFREQFPGIRTRLATLNYHFCMPFYRELILSWGLISASRKSIVSVLSQSNNKLAVCNFDGYTSNAAVLVLGGAQEAFYARPGSDYRLVLRNRKGFVKIAIETGTSLVPVISFGELDVIDQVSNEPGTKIRAFQDFFKKWTGVAPILIFGRGLTENSYGLIPNRREINTVIGEPIDVEKKLNPSKDDIDNLHAKFVAGIEKLFNENRSKYVKTHVKLIIE